MAEGNLKILITAVDQASNVLKGVNKHASSMQDNFRKLTGEIPGLNSALNLMTNPLTLVGAGIAAAGKFAADATKETIAYNKQIREMSTFLGLGAEETSRIVQVADDWGIQIETVRTALGMMTKNGLQPSIENLADLADEFVNTTDKTAFAEKASKLLGRQWQTLIPILQGGGDALRDQAAAVDKSLIATDKSIKAAREYEVAMDGLGDAVSGVKYQIGNQLLPILTMLANRMNENVSVAGELMEAVDADTISYVQAMIIGNKYNLHLISEKEALEELAAVKAANADKTDLVTDAERKATLMAEKYGVEVKKAGEEIDKASQSITGYNGYLAANSGAADEAAEANSRVSVAIGDVTKAALAREALDALNQYYADTGDEEGYEKATRQVMTTLLGMTQQSIDAQFALMDLKEDLADGKLTAMQYKDQIIALDASLAALDGKSAKTFVTTIFTNMTAQPTIQGGQITAAKIANKAVNTGTVPKVEKDVGGWVYPGQTANVHDNETLTMTRGGGYITNNFNMNVFTNAGSGSVKNDYNLMKAMARQ